MDQSDVQPEGVSDATVVCWCCQHGGPIDRAELILIEIVEDIVTGRLTPGRAYWVAQWGPPGMRPSDIERVTTALAGAGLARDLGRGRFEILNLNGEVPDGLGQVGTGSDEPT